MNASLDPILKIFLLAHSKKTSSVGSSMADRALALFLMGAVRNGLDCFALHDIETIKQTFKAKGMAPPDIPLDTPITLRISGLDPIATPLIPTAWSVAGLLCHMGKNVCLQHLMMGKLHEAGHRFQGFSQPESLPIVEPFLLPRGLTAPLGLWLPAYKDSEGRLHDLMDLSVECRTPHSFSLAAEAVQSLSAPTEMKAAYLARQAAHAYDIAVTDVIPLKRKAAIQKGHPITPEGAPSPQEMIAHTGMDSYVCMMLAQALMNGASISQSAWSGPGENARPFCHPLGPLKEIVHSFGFFADNKAEWDEIRAKTLQRMANEGHDIVIAHEAQANNKQQKRHALLPLHFWASMMQPKTVAVLLQSGADTKALVYDVEGEPQTGRSVHEVIETMGESGAEIGAMVQSVEARRVAMATMMKMDLQEPPHAFSFNAKNF